MDVLFITLGRCDSAGSIVGVCLFMINSSCDFDAILRLKCQSIEVGYFQIASQAIAGFSWFGGGGGFPMVWKLVINDKANNVHSEKGLSVCAITQIKHALLNISCITTCIKHHRYVILWLFFRYVSLLQIFFSSICPCPVHLWRQKHFLYTLLLTKFTQVFFDLSQFLMSSPFNHHQTGLPDSITIIITITFYMPKPLYLFHLKHHRLHLLFLSGFQGKLFSVLKSYAVQVSCWSQLKTFIL